MEKVHKKLQAFGQEHLLKKIDDFSAKEKELFFSQIEHLNFPLLREQKKLLESPSPLWKGLEPFEDYSFSGDQQDIKKGLSLIAEGKAGAILIAGGQGTRLQKEGPKGAFPVSLIKKKSLFQIFGEKVLEAGRRAGSPLSLAVMTSPQNKEETEAFFLQHDFFQLERKEVYFFSQGMLPLLDEKGHLFFDSPGHIAEGPNGNGSSLFHFYESGLWEAWAKKGIEYVTFVLIDNPLADPFDPGLLGHTSNQEADIVIKCIARKDPKENVGILVKEEGKAKVIEYSEFPQECKEEKKNGDLKFPLANLSLFSFSIDFMKKGAPLSLPLHLAKKMVPFLDKEGKRRRSEKPNAWKFETFIFDLLPYALKVKALVYPREECFSPLKDLDSLKEVQKALLRRDRQILQEISGKEPPDFPIELSQEFYYPRDELLKRWKGKTITEGGYIKG